MREGAPVTIENERLAFSTDVGGGPIAALAMGVRGRAREKEIDMARASRMSVLKRKRESEKAEKAARKREERDVEKEFGKPKEKESGEASQEDLEAYGLFQPSDEEEEDED